MLMSPARAWLSLLKMIKWMKFNKIVQYIWSKTGLLMGNLGTNTIKDLSNKKLYIILSTLQKNLKWNQTVLITKYQQVNR